MELISKSKSLMLVAVAEAEDGEGDAFHFYCTDPIAEAGLIEYAALIHHNRMDGITGNNSTGG